MTTATLDIRPAESRYTTDIGWLHSEHSFSFGPHQDTANNSHDLLIVSNDDRVVRRGGFGAHGAIELGDHARRLAEGDAARLTDAGRVTLTAQRASEVIVWESDNEVQQ